MTPERTPLAAFGERSSSVVAGVLSRAGISFLGGSAGREVRHDGSLLLKSGNLVPADQVVAAPRLRGERITGVPADPSGFIPTDGVGRVLGLRGVYAAGDATTFPVKQAGLSTQQADRVAQAILGGDAASQAILGGDAASQSIVSGDAAGQRIPSGDAPAQATRTPRVLRARLLADQQPLFFTTELDDDGRVTSASVTSASRPGSIYTKVSARYLAPYLEGLRISREATLVAAS